MKCICPSCDQTFKLKEEPKYCPSCGAAMKSGHAEIVMVLDRSGSMSSCVEATIGGFNDFIRDQKDMPGSASVTLVQFDNEYEVVHDSVPLDDMPELNTQVFVPRGGTALFDAIGKTLNGAAARFRHNKVIFVVLTDGGENSSKEYTQQQIRDLVSQRETNGWTFVYIGANQDAFAVGGAMAFSKSVNYAATPEGTRGAYAEASNLCRTARSQQNN